MAATTPTVISRFDDIFVCSRDLPPPFIPERHEWDPNYHGSRFRAVMVRTPNYLEDDNFYMAFVPEDPQFSQHPLLASLDYASGSFPISTLSNGTYGLPVSVVAKWRSLESLLYTTIRTLQIYIFQHHPFHLRLYWPSLSHYDRSHPTYGKAQFMAWVTRETFVSVFAYLAFLIHRCKLQDREFWAELLHQDGRLPSSWVNTIQNWPAATIFDSSVRRIGGLVYPYKQDGRTPQWLPEIASVRKAGLSLWLPYGPITSRPTETLPLPSDLIPSNDEIKLAIAQRDEDQRRRDRSGIISSNGVQPDAPPRIVTWQMYFERRRETNLNIEKRESVHERNARLQRKLHYDGPNGQNMPSTRTTARIFYWELVLSGDDAG